MPIYRYKCEAHGEFDHHHQMGKPLHECPTCPSGTKVEKVFQTFGVSAAKDPQVGQVVKRTIEETKEEMKRNKKESRGKTWE
jgi:putative FmdB family regulatory protein